MFCKIVEKILQHVCQKAALERPQFVLLHSLALPDKLHGFLKILSLYLKIVRLHTKTSLLAASDVVYKFVGWGWVCV